MNETEWQDTVSFARDDIRQIIRAQRRLRDIRNALDTRNENPLEEDFIDADLGAESVGRPSSFDVDGVHIITRKLHRRGLGSRDVVGADLLYEIEGLKYAVIQYKTPDARGSVKHDAHQLQDLRDGCPETFCDGRRRWPRCGSWHAIRSKNLSLYHPACEAQSIFHGAGSRSTSAFASGLSKEAFDELFAVCWVGAPISPSGMAMLTTSSINANRVLFSVTQRGRF